MRSCRNFRPGRVVAALGSAAALAALAISAPGQAQAVAYPRSERIALVPNEYGRTNNGGTLPTSGFSGGYNPEFSAVTPESIRDAAADPISTNFDTVVLNGLCDIDSFLSTGQFKARIEAFVSNGGKLLIWDSECTSTDYSRFAVPFRTSNPGAAGATGTLVDAEENTLSSGNATSPSYVNVAAVSTGTDAVGDSNVFTTYDSRWFVDLKATNTLGVNGPVQAYANLGKGLIVYSGLDKDYMGAGGFDASSMVGAVQLNRIWMLELLQPWNPDGLPDSTPAASSQQISNNANEPIVAVNPTNPKNIVVAFNHFTPGKNLAACGYRASKDGGLTWGPTKDLPLPTEAGVEVPGGDPSLAFDSTGRLYFSCLVGYRDDVTSVNSTTALALYDVVSTDGGATFSTPHLIVKGSGTKFQCRADLLGVCVIKGNGQESVIQPDQEQLAGESLGSGGFVCYAQQIVMPGSKTPLWGIIVARLDAAGNVTARGSAAAGLKETGTLGCTVGVGATGRLWVGWWNNGDQKAEVAYSDNAATGASLSFAGHAVLGDKRGYGIFNSPRHVWIRPATASGDKRALAVWEDDTTSVHDVRGAAFDGTTWSSSQSLFHNAYQPALAWGADGSIAVGFYQDSTATPTASSLRYTVLKLNWPLVVTSLHALAAQTSNANANLSPSPAGRFGDYTSVAQVDGVASAVWTDNSSGAQTVWFGH